MGRKSGLQPQPHDNVFGMVVCQCLLLASLSFPHPRIEDNVSELWAWSTTCRSLILLNHWPSALCWMKTAICGDLSGRIHNRRTGRRAWCRLHAQLCVGAGIAGIGHSRCRMWLVVCDLSYVTWRLWRWCILPVWHLWSFLVRWSCSRRREGWSAIDCRLPERSLPPCLPTLSPNPGL